MANCPASCGVVTLVANPSGTCSTELRYQTLSRVGFYPCSETLPDPLTESAIQQLVIDDVIVFSSVLANVVLADPTTEDIVVDDCTPARTIITGRQLTAEDRVAISYASGSPATTTDYADYTFWDDKIVKQQLMNTFLVMCNGDVILPYDRNGRPLRATMLVYISYQKPSTQGGQAVEFKKITINFNGDPVAFFTAVPAFNLNTWNITL